MDALYAQTELSFNFGYASTGNSTWKDDDREVVEMQESPSALVDGEITIQDKSYGLMTWKGYQNLLATAAAHQINVSLARQLTFQPGLGTQKRLKDLQ